MNSTGKKPKILFVCIGNMIRSQMAEGFAREFGGSFLEVYSAGIAPTGAVSEEAIIVMDEKGIDMTKHYSKGLRDVPFDEMDYVVSLFGRPVDTFCPDSFKGRKIDWDITDPLGRSFEFFRTVRDDMELKVKDLVQQIWRESSATRTK